MVSGAPELIGRYVVDRELGSGGMGEVFLAYSPAGDPVAVKLIRSDRLDPVARDRFEKEAQIARTIVGTNRVARFLDADPYAARPWIAMEYIPGSTLAAEVDAHGPLSVPLVASLAALLAEGLEAVHTAGLLHRDLKPQNVILGEYGPVLIDFGLGAFLDSAKGSLSHTGMVIGTVRSMPPEQATGNPKVTPAADVYGLGAVLLYAATGHSPYDGVRWEAIASQVADPNHLPDLGGLPAELVPLVSSMLAYEPEVRPALSAVMTQSTGLLTEAGISPVEARYALIDRTREDRSAAHVPAARRDLLVRVAEKVDLSETDARLRSPLDHPPQEREPETKALPETRSGREQPGDVDSGPAPPGGDGGKKLPASRRVAEELREQYAMRLEL
ncbi:serine/threonine-protein kinase [Parafrankia elaeagni]|uniref:serine/threonine-protein kinase n=1 Tax=Parafrankia elaeagni TaxID=222534 RepID=UPI00036C2785|nr:serine/threonine-protein kinase [Parafrankia elaeagni]